MKIHLIDLELFFREDESYAAVAHVHTFRACEQARKAIHVSCVSEQAYLYGFGNVAIAKTGRTNIGSTIQPRRVCSAGVIGPAKLVQKRRAFTGAA